MSTEATPLHPAQTLRDLFTLHGVAAQTTGDTVWVEDEHLRVRALIVRHRRHADVVQLQLDVTILHPDLEAGAVTESFVGIGADDRAALGDALHHCIEAVFHVLLSVLLLRPSSHATQENWVIQGQSRRVVMGSLCTRGEFPAEGWPARFQLLKEQIGSVALPVGSLHAVSFFASRSPGAAPIVYVSLNGTPPPGLDMQPLVDSWPEAPSYYSARLFALIDDVVSGA